MFFQETEQRTSVGVRWIDPSEVSEVGSKLQVLLKQTTALSFTCQPALAWPSKQMGNFEQDLGGTSAGA